MCENYTLFSYLEKYSQASTILCVTNQRRITPSLLLYDTYRNMLQEPFEERQVAVLALRAGNIFVEAPSTNQQMIIIG